MTLRLAAPGHLRTHAVATAATLPDDYRLSDTGNDATLVDGSGDWATTALHAVTTGTVIVHAPGPVAADQVEKLAAAATEPGVPVVLSERFAGNPLLERLPELTGVTSVAVTTIAGDDLTLGLLEQLRTLRAIGVVDLVAENAHRSEHATLITGHATLGPKTVRVRLLSTSSSILPPHQTIRAYTADTVITVTLPDAATAAPGVASIVGPDGEHILPTDYESAHRRAWRTALDTTETAASLIGFARDLRILAGLTGTSH